MTPEHKKYLDNLRESGEVNMFGAIPYLQRAFLLEKQEARLILNEWIQTYE